MVMKVTVRVASVSSADTFIGVDIRLTCDHFALTQRILLN